MIKGVLFDMDGVLVDTEEYICRAAMMMFREKGIVANESDFKPFTGMGENRYIGGVAEKYGVPYSDEMKARTYEIYAQLVKGKLSPLTGAKEFIARCMEKGLKLAVASSADSVKVEVNLRESGIGKKVFGTIVNGLDVKNKKPAPDIYLKAAEELGLDPAGCLVVEDAVSGVKAGKAAGCRCLAVTTSFSAAELHEADWVFSSLKDVPDEVINW
ncbi:MAG TPA: HAD-IA family hydrolase [Bacteroidales bacterium]|jgi:HAD superfamily hydrolase (TIGR01509 family)|nr:HAD-IA family hydrolase [Bacteroidales bacterium]